MRAYCTTIRQTRTRESQKNTVSPTYGDDGLAGMHAPERKPFATRSESGAKTDFSRVYFQNVRLLLAGAEEILKSLGGIGGY